MDLIVQKFGGTSLADAAHIRRVAKIITNTYQSGNNVIAVVSAQGKTTDQLISNMNEINPNASKREMDMLLSAGEQMSSALLAMEIEKLGFPVISLCSWQFGMMTNSIHGCARILDIKCTRILKELDKRQIIIATGFQGVDQYHDITTLGRGGSDTSAVALAAKFNAKLCQIYTDVDGVYTGDPRIIKTATKLAEISFDEMLELASLGAQVLHTRSVEMAKKYKVNLEVLSSLENKSGTKIKEITNMEKMVVRGVAKDDDIARVAILNLPDEPGIAFKVFSLMSKHNINVDIILQSIGRDFKKDIIFTIPREQISLAKEVLEKNLAYFNAQNIEISDEYSKVSIVGAGMQSNPGIAAKMFEALSESNINIHAISTSEIKISVLINRTESKRAVNVIHDAFLV